VSTSILLYPSKALPRTPQLEDLGIFADGLTFSDDRHSGVTSKAPLVHLKHMGRLSDAATESLMELD
jgi:hypothetical protein